MEERKAAHISGVGEAGSGSIVSSQSRMTINAPSPMLARAMPSSDFNVSRSGTAID